jgi:hypothetical protein
LAIRVTAISTAIVSELNEAVFLWRYSTEIDQEEAEAVQKLLSVLRSRKSVLRHMLD